MVGCTIVSVGTVLLGFAVYMPNGAPFIIFTLSMQVLQGFGSALAETVGPSKEATEEDCKAWVQQVGRVLAVLKKMARDLDLEDTRKSA